MNNESQNNYIASSDVKPLVHCITMIFLHSSIVMRIIAITITIIIIIIIIIIFDKFFLSTKVSKLSNELIEVKEQLSTFGSFDNDIRTMNTELRTLSQKVSMVESCKTLIINNTVKPVYSRPKESALFHSFINCNGTTTDCPDYRGVMHFRESTIAGLTV